MKLSTGTIEAIRALGLYIADTPDFEADHCAFPDGYVVSKPKTVGGNSIPNYEVWTKGPAGDDIECDAPGVFVFGKEGIWHCAVSLYAPGPGPGEFCRAATGEAGVIAELRHYYFGPSEDFRMLLEYCSSR
ncbi:hypothetical protein OOT46_29900 [Aquabacterium sp. A7-Y]|uniref:hypothetical protein n=1 Tax=Aquabacterium sp. A7-Y TaxID=1349605 RepID=UPI00223D68B0|nr:hypothetical protein [Aquabacterium sp. A7-Y]MCW7542015.1 hypothetical protein [Aquabacterium sp. A7-Y]